MKLSSDDQLTLRCIREQIADANSEWWPFAFVRPKKHEHFTTMRCALLALLYGLPVALFVLVAGQLLGDPVQNRHLALLPLLVTVAEFALLRVGVVSFWNQRAAELRPLHERRAEWQRSLVDD